MASSPNPNPNPRPAIAALLKWLKSQSQHEKSQLFEHDDLLYLILTLTKIPSKSKTNPYRIPIPHSLHPFNPQSTSICIILDDSPSSPLLPASALDQIKTLNLPISSVIGLSELQSDYKPFESRRKLCESYDLFFADRKILPLLPRSLGKHFFKRKKIPLAVDFSRVGWVEQIKSWCGSSLLYLRSGSCCGLKIGRMNMGLDEIVENAMAALEGALKVVPKKWKGLRSIHVKAAGSVALPVYQKVPEIGMKIEVWDENEGEKKEKKRKKEKIDDVGVEKREKKKSKKGEEKKMVTEDEEGSALLNSGEDENLDDELSKKKSKKNKKKKMEVGTVVASEGMDKRKVKKKNDDDVALNDELGTKKKAKKGEKAKELKAVVEENGADELAEKRIKKKKLEGSVGVKKSKPKNLSTKM